ncbi:MAG: acetyl-CoA C-acetyltransferase [Oscillospiraceae bacterium]|nr:acetyl-CoA C-acetyltransferase [Oscillospiraceae bacterium]
MKNVYILGACRTPIGKMGGALSSISAVDLGAAVIREALLRAKIPADRVEHVYMGCVLQAALGQNVARQAALKAGIPFTSTAQTLNVVCGSGLEAVNAAARLIQSEEADIVVAGGTESMSQAPFALTQGRFGYRMGSPMINTPLIDTMVNDALWDAINDYHMGFTAENVAERWGISRMEMDAFAVDSQNKAERAQADGAFSEEIVPIVIQGKKGAVTVAADDGPRPGTTVEALAKLRPAFKPYGLVTAGNSSGINDGAAAVVLVSERMLRELGLKPQALWLGSAMAGVDPAIMGVGPVASTEKLLKKMNMTIDEIDLFEANEAFAAQSLAVKRELGIASEKLNVNGGAIALGHPVGASGCRILVTLIHAMKKRGVKTGLATLCVGGGMGCSTMIRMEPDDV